MLGCMNHKVDSRLPGEISISSDIQMIALNDRKQRRTRELLDEGQRGSEKHWLKT